MSWMKLLQAPDTLSLNALNGTSRIALIGAGAAGLAVTCGLLNRGVRELLSYGIFGGSVARGDILHNLVQLLITMLPPQARVDMHWRQQTNLPMLAAAFELGIFDDLKDGPLSFEELLKRVGSRSSSGVDRRCLGGLVRAMVSAGWLIADRDTLRSVFRSHELREVRIPVMMTHTTMQRQMYHIAEGVRTGKAAGLTNVFGSEFESLYHANALPEVQTNWRPWMESQRRRGWDRTQLSVDVPGQLRTALQTLARMPGAQPLPPAPRVLDWCGSHGYHSMMASKRFLPTATFNVLDLPHVCDEGRRRAAEEGLQDKVTFFSSDLSDPNFALPAEGQYDIVFMWHCLPEWPISEVRRFLSVICRGLRPGGAVIMNMFTERTEFDFAWKFRWSAYGAAAPLYEWNGDSVMSLYFQTVAAHTGNPHSHADVRAALEDAGFGAISFTGPGEYHPVVAVKKGFK